MDGVGWIRKRRKRKEAETMDRKSQEMLGLMIGLSGGTTQEWSDTVERAGQATVVNTETLPKDTGYGKGGLAPYEQMGITFHGDHDDIFLKATLPPGWTKKRTVHYMWSNVLDEKGRERISIFYKPEFYDRSAHMNLERRYRVGRSYSEDGDSVTFFIRDCEVNIHTIGTASGRKDESGTYHKQAGALEAQAVDWLSERYPDWEKPLSYWD